MQDRQSCSHRSGEEVRCVRTQLLGQRAKSKVATKQDLMLPPIRQGGQSSDTYLLDVLVMAYGTKKHEVRCLSD